MAIRMFAILTLLLSISTILSPVHSNLQHESVVSNHGTILVQESFAERIFFQYGGETGDLQPPWDLVGAHGSGDTTGSYVQIENSHVRSGSQAIKFYQVPPPKSDAQRRVELRYFNTAKEMYVSWWAYFPSDSHWNDTASGWGNVLGGWQSFFGPPSLSYKWYVSGRFGITQTARYIVFRYVWGAMAGEPEYSSEASAQNVQWDTPYYIEDYMDQWVHFQVYIKWAKGNSGIVRAWFNNNLVAKLTGIKTDPEGFDEWDANACVYWSGYSSPFVVVEHYTAETSTESWFWVDDIVAATEKVPSGYRVKSIG